MTPLIKLCRCLYTCTAFYAQKHTKWNNDKLHINFHDFSRNVRIHTSGYFRPQQTDLTLDFAVSLKKSWILEYSKQRRVKTDQTTVITISIGTDMPLQTVQTQIRRRRMRRLIRVHIVCHTYSNILDTSRVVEWTISNFRTSMVSR